MSICLSCSIFKNEIEALQEEGLLNCEAKYLNSMLHLNPAKMEVLLGKEILEQGDNSIVLIYGDCCPAMHDFSNKANVECTRGRNCCELLLGKETYLKFLKDGAFFLMPEWVERWKEVFLTYMKLNKSSAVDMMGHLHKYFLYLDSGKVTIPVETLNEISDYFELPWKVEKIDIKKNFLKILRKTMEIKGDN